MRYTDARSNCFFDIFRLPCICCGCISVSEAQSGTGSTEHCPGSLYRHIFFWHFNAPRLAFGFLVASSASSGIREKCIPDSVRCLDQLLIRFMGCIPNLTNTFCLSCQTRCSCLRLHVIFSKGRERSNMFKSAFFLTICLRFHFCFLHFLYFGVCPRLSVCLGTLP